MANSNQGFDRIEVAQNALLIEYLGQAGYRIKSATTTFLIDPYLSNYVVDGGFGPAEIFGREFPPPEDPRRMENVDFVFITHDHADHCDPQTLHPLVQANPHLKIIAPITAARTLQSAGINPAQFLDPSEGQRRREGELTFAAIPSAHYELDSDPATGTAAYLGYVIESSGVVLYHSGDTILYPGLLKKLKNAAAHFDLVCLPVNGRDARREAMGMVGNLDSREALELALQLEARVLLPMHNDLFAANRVNPGILADISSNVAPRQRIHWLQPGELYLYIQ